MGLELVIKNRATGMYEGKCICYVCENTYELLEGRNAELIAERAGRYDHDGYYAEFAVYSKCPHCKHNNKHYREAKIK